MSRYVMLIMLAVAACRRADDNPIGDSVVTLPAESTAIDTAAQQSPDGTALKTCGVQGTPRLDEEGIGELRQGRQVSEIAESCEILSDSQQRGTEGQMERVLLVRIAGETVRATIVDDRVWRIQVNSPRFRTTDSLGVDTPLRRISAMRGAQFAPGEDGVYGFSPEHCGLSFRFSVPMRPPAGGQWTTARIEAEHGDAAVNRVLVIPCRR